MKKLIIFCLMLLCLPVAFAGEETFEIIEIRCENTSEVVLVFNQPLDQKTSEAPGNYQIIDQVTGKNVPLISSHKIEDNIVRLQYTKGPSKALVKIDGVYDQSLKSLYKGSRSFDVVDAFNPKINEIRGVGDHLLEVIFSEPMKTSTLNKKSITLDGGKYHIKALSYYDGGRGLFIETYEYLDSGNIEVAFSYGVTDLVNKQVINPKVDALFLVDVRPLEIIGYKNDYPNRIDLIFNKPIKILSPLLQYYGHTNQSNPISRNLSEDDLSQNRRVLTFPFDKTPLPYTYGNFYIDQGAVGDLYGQVSEDLTYGMTFKSDITPPVLKAQTVLDERHVSLTYNENIDPSLALDKENYRIEDTITNTSLGLSKVTLEGNVVTLKTKNALPEHYQIKVKGQRDLYGNLLGREEIALDNTTSNLPLYLSQADVYERSAQGNGRLFSIDFHRKMATAGYYSPIDHSRYLIKGQPLPDTAYLSLSDQEVLLALSEEELKALGVESNVPLDLTLFKMAASDGTLSSDGPVEKVSRKQAPIQVLSAQMPSVEEIKVIFEDAVFFVSSDLEVVLEESGEKVLLSGQRVMENSQGQTEVYLKLLNPGQVDGTFKGEKMLLKVIDDQTKNKYQVKIKAPQTLNVVDRMPPEVKAITLKGRNLWVETNEYVYGKDPRALSKNFLLEFEGAPLYYGIDYEVRGAYQQEPANAHRKKGLDIRLSKNIYKKEGTLSIEYLEDNGGVKDSSNNPLAPFKTVYIDR